MTSTETTTWAFLGKEPSLLHQSLADYILEETEGEVEITPRQVQAVLAMHGPHQRSSRNKSRPDYKPRTEESIRKGGQTTAEKHGGIVLEETPAPEAESVEKPKATRKPRTRRTPAKTTDE